MITNGIGPNEMASAMSLTWPNNNVFGRIGITLEGSDVRNHSLWQGKWIPLDSNESSKLNLAVPSASAGIVKIFVK